MKALKQLIANIFFYFAWKFDQRDIHDLKADFERAKEQNRDFIRETKKEIQ